MFFNQAWSSTVILKVGSAEPLASIKQNQGFCKSTLVKNSEHSCQPCKYIPRLHVERQSISKNNLVLVGYLSPLFFTRYLSPTLYTPLQCTLPRTFTYRACPFSVHCLSCNIARECTGWGINSNLIPGEKKW